jgi:glutamine---fructose-6-phosphate transaminase (isomerizing)
VTEVSTFPRLCRSTPSSISPASFGRISRGALAGIAEHVFLVGAGREKSVAATKTYTGQLMIRIADLEAIPDFDASALTLETEVGGMAERYRFMHHAIVAVRGLNYANAFEFEVKMMETSYVVAERFSSADFLHGPIAMVEPNFPVFLFTPSGPTWPSMQNMLTLLRELKAETVVRRSCADSPPPMALLEL